MKYQSNRNYKSNDVIMTPESLAIKIIKHFNPIGKILEPCKGTGSFYNNFPKDCEKDWCEISKGKDFLKYDKKVEWIITNPPWSKIRKFLQKSMEVSNNIIFLCTINHLWTKARLRDIKESNFGIKEILLFDCKELNNSGFQLGCFYIKKDYNGDIKLRKLELLK